VGISGLILGMGGGLAMEGDGLTSRRGGGPLKGADRLKFDLHSGEGGKVDF